MSTGAADAGAGEAPWFYRKRFYVFGLLYGVAFFFGFLISGFIGVQSVPAYRATPYPAALAVLAVALTVGGWALRAWASSYLSPTVVWRAEPQSTVLRVCGPYRFTRNPLYLGNILQALGIGLVCPWPVLVLLGGLMVAYNYALIAVEEPFLSRTQGTAYDGYRAMVPRLVPVLWRHAPPGNQRPSPSQGLRSEIALGLVALGMVLWVAATWR